MTTQPQYDKGVKKIAFNDDVLSSDGKSIKVDIGGATIEATLGDIKSAVTDVTLQDAATAVGTGTTFTVGANKTITVDVYGTAVGGTVIFEASGAAGVWYPIRGIRLSDYSMNTQTSSFGEVWSFDVVGVTSFRARISALTSGNVSVKGKAVS
jgi:hypothetical protein